MKNSRITDEVGIKRTIRLATKDDLPCIMKLIACGRQKMRAIGNVDQWTDGNPRKETILQDIVDENSYLVEDDGVPVATFAFMEGPEPTYEHIYQGEWIDSLSEYYVIHRIASAPNTCGILKFVLDYCSRRTTNICIDTHRQNVIMRYALPKYGFRYCGIIYLMDGAERLAYQRAWHLCGRL